MPDLSSRQILLPGGTGFLGTSLIPPLRHAGYEPIILTRSPDRAQTANDPTSARHVHWDARTLGPWVRELDGAAGIINLVGRTVDCRKTSANKREILQSRIDSVNVLAQACPQVHHP